MPQQPMLNGLHPDGQHEGASSSEQDAEEGAASSGGEGRAAEGQPRGVRMPSRMQPRGLPVGSGLGPAAGSPGSAPQSPTLLYSTRGAAQRPPSRQPR